MIREAFVILTRWSDQAGRIMLAAAMWAARRAGWPIHGGWRVTVGAFTAWGHLFKLGGKHGCAGIAAAFLVPPVAVGLVAYWVLSMLNNLAGGIGVMAGLAAAVAVLGWAGRPPGDQAVLGRDQEKIAEALAGRLSGVTADMLEVSPLVRVFTDDGTTGRQCTIKAPLWIEASQVAQHRAVIASALKSKTDRITVTEGATPAQSLVHVADKSPSELPPSPWPLVDAHDFDLTRPIPIGTTPDGKPAHLQLFDRDARGDLQSYHLLLTGMSRYGKSSLLQLILSAAALDDRAVLDVTVLGQHTRDFEDIAPALSFLTVNAGVDDLHAQLDRGLARMGSKIRTPYVLVIDEAQFHLGEKGDAAARTKLKDLLASAGKAAISVIIVTQDPIKENLAPDLARRPQNRISFRQPQPESAQRAMGSGMTPDIDPAKFGGGDKGLAAVISEDGFRGRVKTPLIHEDVVKRIAQDHAREAVEPEFPVYSPTVDNDVQDPEPYAPTVVDLALAAMPEDRDKAAMTEVLGWLMAVSDDYADWTPEDVTRALKAAGWVPRGQGTVWIDGKSRRGVYRADLEAVGGVQV